MSDENLLQIGHKIRSVRELQNISQEFLANSINISQPYLSRIENGDAKISFEMLLQIAEVLQLDVNAIVNFDKSYVFNSCTQSGCFNHYAFNGVEELRNVYEKLIAEKDERIKLLEKISALK